MKKHKLSLLTTLPILIGSALAVCVGTITPVLATYYNVIEDNFFLVESGGYTFKCFNITDAQEQPVANSVAIAWGQNAEETPETLPVPSTVSYNSATYTVKAIAKHAFRYCDFKEISLPTTIEYIGEEAFAYCMNLKTFSIPNKVDKINPSTFLDCRALETIKYTDESGNVAFGNETITEIGDHAFDSCISLRNFYTPKRCTYFGFSSFKNCRSLVNFYFPSEVKVDGVIQNPITVKSYAFADCKSLVFIYFETNMHEIDNYAFVDVNENAKIKYTGTKNPDGTYSEDGVKQTRWRNLYTATNKESIKIPIEIKHATILFDDEYPCLRYSVVSDAVKLDAAQNRETSVYVIDQAEAEDKYAVIYKFDTPNETIDNCFDVDTGSLIIPNTINGKTVKVIKQSAFANNLDITSVTFNKDLVQICNQAFLNCSNIASINFNLCKKLKEVSYFVFQNDNANSVNDLVTDLVLPDGLEYIGGYAFAKFRNVTNLVLPNSLKAIDDLCFYQVGFNVTEENALVDLVLPKTLNDAAAVAANFKHIKKGSFKHEDYKWFFAIGKYAFNECNCIRTVTMEEDDTDGVTTSFYSNCFNGASNLIRFKANKNLQYLGKDAFKSCQKLREVFLTYEKSEASGCDYPWCIDEAEEAGLYGGTLFFGVHNELVCYVDGPRAPGILDNYHLTSEITGKIQNNTLWNAETPENNKSYDSYLNQVKNGTNLGRRVVPTYYNTDLNSVKYWNPKTKAIINNPPLTTADYDAGIMSFVKNTSGKYIAVRYYMNPNLNTGTAFIDLTAVPDISDGTKNDLIKIGDSCFGYGSLISGTNDNRDRQPGLYFVLPTTITEIGERAFYRSTNGSEPAKGNGRYGVRLITYKDSSGNYYKENGSTGTFADIQSAISAIQSPYDADKRGWCVLPPNISKIGSLAFYNNIFKTVRINSSISYLGTNVFYSHNDGNNTRSTIETLVMDNSINSTFKSDNNGIYYVGGGDSKKMLVSQASGKSGTLTIADKTMAIGMQAAANTKYTGLELNTDLTTIYGYAFARNKKLTSITGGSALRYIGSMENVRGDSSTWSDPDYEEIWDDSMKSIYLNVDYRGYAYDPRPRIESIGGAFYDCTELLSINFKSMNEIRKIGPNAFNNCKKMNNMTGGTEYVYKQYASGGTITEISDGRTNKSLNVLDLSGCSNLRSIGQGAFTSCENVKYLHLPDNRNGAGESTFYAGYDPEIGEGRSSMINNGNTKVLVGESALYAHHDFGRTNNAQNHYAFGCFGNCVSYYHVATSADIPVDDDSTCKYWTKMADGSFLLFNNANDAREYFPE